MYSYFYSNVLSFVLLFIRIFIIVMRTDSIAINATIKPFWVGGALA